MPLALPVNQCLLNDHDHWRGTVTRMCSTQMKCQTMIHGITVLLTPRTLRVLLLIAVCSIGSSSVQAQSGFGRPNDRPTFSPYLNLFRNQNGGSSGGNTLLNYYGLVRPQNQAFEQRQQINEGLSNLRRTTQQRGVNQRRGVPQYSQLGITGHPTAFMTIRPGVGGGGGDFGGFGGSIGGGSIGAGSFGVGTTGFGDFGGAGGFNGSFSGVGTVGGVGGFGLGSVTGHPAAFSAGTRINGAGFSN